MPAVSAADRLLISVTEKDGNYMIKIVKTAGILIFLVVCSAQDIREKRLSVKVLVASGILFLGVSLIFEDISIEKRLHNILPGMIAFLLAFLTKEQVGYGDAACLIVLGTLVSAAALAEAVMGGLILLSICSVILLTGKRADRNTALPFLPFLSAGMLWQMIIHNI